MCTTGFAQRCIQHRVWLTDSEKNNANLWPLLSARPRMIHEQLGLHESKTCSANCPQSGFCRTWRQRQFLEGKCLRKTSEGMQWFDSCEPDTSSEEKSGSWYQHTWHVLVVRRHVSYFGAGTLGWHYMTTKVSAGSFGQWAHNQNGGIEAVMFQPSLSSTSSAITWQDQTVCVHSKDSSYLFIKEGFFGKVCNKKVKSYPNEQACPVLPRLQSARAYFQPWLSLGDGPWSADLKGLHQCWSAVSCVGSSRLEAADERKGRGERTGRGWGGGGGVGGTQQEDTKDVQDTKDVNFVALSRGSAELFSPWFLLGLNLCPLHPVQDWTRHYLMD